MIPAGLTNALVCWADGHDDRIAALTTERDALALAILTGGQPVSTLTNTVINGQTFSFLPGLTVTEKLTLITDALRDLGQLSAATDPVVLTYGRFCQLQR